MTVLASDNFNRANNADLGTDWTPLTVNWVACKVLSNECANGTTNANAGEYWSGALIGGGGWPNDQFSEVTIGSLPESVSDNGGGGQVRVTPSSGSGDSSYYGQGCAVQTRLYKMVTGTVTQLGSDGPTVTTGDVLRTIANGTAIRVEKNGSPVIGPVTDAALSSGSAGVLCDSPTTTSVDLWQAGDLITSQPTSQQAKVGDTAIFTVTGGSTYQWQDNSGGSFANVSGGSGATTASYTTATITSGFNGRRYRCVVNGSNSNSASLDILLPGSLGQFDPDLRITAWF